MKLTICCCNVGPNTENEVPKVPLEFLIEINSIFR